MLCVICATSGSLVRPLDPLWQADADVDPLAEPAGGQRRQRLGRRLALGLGLGALAVGASWPSAVSTFACGVSGRFAGLLETAKPARLPSEPVSSPT